MSFKFEYLISYSLGFVFLNGEAITSVPCTIIFISSKGRCVDSTCWIFAIQASPSCLKH